jgi:hypothetical protein
MEVMQLFIKLIQIPFGILTTNIYLILLAKLVEVILVQVLVSLWLWLPILQTFY